MFNKTHAQPCVSYLREVFTKNGKSTLHQSKITSMEPYADFTAFAQDFWKQVAYPKPQSDKYECYSWTPTLFAESFRTPKSKPDADPQWGLWRVGEACTGEVTVGYFDLDNQHDDQPMIDIDTVEAVLRDLGVSFLLYTSFSHKPERHKVRIVCPISRNASYDEMFLVFVWMNHRLHYQLDASIYDPGDHLYGPCFDGERREWLDGQSLDVDAIMGMVEDLPDEALVYAKRAKDTKGSNAKREMTPEEIAHFQAQVADLSVTGASIKNPAIFNPKWMDDLRDLYNGGSHRQTLLGVLSRIWLKSKCSLTFGDMCSLQDELDAEWGFYCRRHYGKSALQSDVRSVMTLHCSAPSIPAADERTWKLEQKMRLLARKRGSSRV